MFRPLAFTALLLCLVSSAGAQDAPDADAARSALEKAGAVFRDRLGVSGTYVWRYSVDGKVRRGEGGEVGPTLGWVQPPGTPAVGAAFLRLYELTGDEAWLKAAGVVAHALLRGQLRSGGWFQSIETDPKLAAQWCYRADLKAEEDCRSDRSHRDRDRSVLDDNNTQSAVNFLIWFDRSIGGTDPAVREGIDYALARLTEIQYPNGAFPVSFSDEAPGSDEESAARASLPDDWPRVWQKPDDPPYFVTNDNLQRDVGRLFLNAFRAYREPVYLQVAMKIGDFLVASQLPRPQSGWAQTYDRSLEPVWGRKFEPPSVASSETAANIEYLVELHDYTSKAAYLDAAGRAVEWLKSVRRPEGDWARFYELGSDRPLYVDADYRLTYDDRAIPDHYTLNGSFGIEAVFDRFESARRGGGIAQEGYWANEAEALDERSLERRVSDLLDDQTAEGYWLADGWIDGQSFVDGVFVLARYVTLSRHAAD